MGWYKIIGGRLVTRYWPVVIVGWLIVATALHFSAPDWDSIAADGDLAFLPAHVPSAVGQRTLDRAFPGSRARSQMVIVLANRDEPLNSGDLAIGLDLARRVHYFAAYAAWNSLADKATLSVTTELSDSQQAFLEIAQDNLNQAVEIDDELARYLGTLESSQPFARLACAVDLRHQLYTAIGKGNEALADEKALELLRALPAVDAQPPAWASAIQDVWTWRDAVLGHKLGSDNQHARILAMQLGNEFSAVGNISVLNGLEQLVDQLRSEHGKLVSSKLEIEISGSAAVGADMLRAAAGSVRLTEGVSIGLVLLILALVYRGPFLVAIPLATIALSLAVATSLIALSARDPTVPASFGLGVFTTTRIFIVVVLFGTGTDFCLFLLARCRETFRQRAVMSRRQLYRAVARSWRSVHNALVASAMTTITGLALMWFSEFEKFRFSGPIIAISLAVTLVVCLSFTPALLSALGRIAFWPSTGSSSDFRQDNRDSNRYWTKIWENIAAIVVARPLLALSLTVLMLGIPAAYGWSCLGWVTYDFAKELSIDAPSRRGARLIAQYFPTLDSSPITIMMIRDEPFPTDQALKTACSALSQSLYTQGVDSVRSVSDPLGDYPPGRRMGLFDKDAWRRRVLQTHRIARSQYVSTVEGLGLRLAKFDVILTDNPFSTDAAATLSNLLSLLQTETQRTASPWHLATIATAGTTVGITDLRSVTQSDQRRIQILVTIGVWVVLVVLLGELILSTYLIMTVLLSYFSTLGLTYLFFGFIYAGSNDGLDWKVPLFLFVILVAVGQDYNVYLTTRIFEEGKRFGFNEGTRRAMISTGGIITSCGFVMAGTFIAMTSPAIVHWVTITWPFLGLTYEAPVLRGITELGFALSLGVLLDTLIVRSVLVPAFIVLWRQRSSSNESNETYVANETQQARVPIH